MVGPKRAGKGAGGCVRRIRGGESSFSPYRSYKTSAKADAQTQVNAVAGPGEDADWTV